MPVPSASNIDGGILVDMSSFNEVNYVPYKQAVVVGSGVRWKDVYSTLDQYNITVVGARIADIGVGGFLLGGKFLYRA
jgi:FAD/FMN-containing dehydrogenase